MRKRKNSSTKNSFWGCVKWTNKDPMSCSGTSNYIAPPEGMPAEGGDKDAYQPASQPAEKVNHVKSKVKVSDLNMIGDIEKIFYNFQEASEYAKKLAMSGGKPLPKLEKIDNNRWVVK